MVTTQIQVLLFVGSRQLVSCSFFVPVPAIVVKSQQQLEAILPYLPIPPSLSSALTFKSAHHPSTQADSATVRKSPTAVTIHRGNRIHKPAKERTRHRHPYAVDCDEGDLRSVQVHDPQYPASTTCIRISLKPNPSSQFLRFRFSRNKSLLQGYPSTHHQHPHHHQQQPYHESLYSSRYDSDDDDDPYDDPYHYKMTAMPRITPVLFTYPFPPPGQHFPSSVQVTGTFDDWQRTTEPLTKNDREQRFEAEIQVDLERLPQIDDPCSSSYERRAEAELDPREVSQQKRKLVYKFILDGNNWLTDPTQPNERDYEGNLNNIWFLEDRTASERLELERQEAEQQRAKEVEDDAITQKLGGGGGLSGTPNLAANDLTTPPSDLTGNHQHPHDHESSNSTGDGDGGEMTHSATTKTLVNPSTTGAFTAGDAKPLQDGSIKTTMAPTEQAPHSPSRSTGDEHDGDGDYGVAILQGDPVTISPLQRTPSTEGAAGDAHPTVDASIAEAGNAPLSINTATTNASASASEQSLASSMSSHPTSSSHAKAPTSPSRSNSNSKSATPKLYGEEAINDNGAVKSAVPTTAVSTTTPQFPSTSSLAVQSNKTGGKKSMWKRFKKVFS